MQLGIVSIYDVHVVHVRFTGMTTSCSDVSECLNVVRLKVALVERIIGLWMCIELSPSPIDIYRAQ